jgi:hypothetical protein
MKYQRILLIGGTGTGKTTQFNTLPGKKFAYLFEPSAEFSLSDDVETQMLLPGRGELDPYPRSLLKGGKQTFDRKEGEVEPKLYLNFLADLNKKFDEGFFDKVDALLVDSLTLLAKANLDRVTYLQRKAKREDERVDYRISGDNIYDAVFQLTTLPCHIIFTLHNKFGKDDSTHKSFNRLALPGSARETIPRLMSNVWVCSHEAGKYMIQSQPTKENPTTRSSVRGIQQYTDVTLDFNKPLVGQGIWGVIEKGEKK